MAKIDVQKGSRIHNDIQKAFSEGSNALYLCIQMICPECNKLVRVSLLANDKSMKVQK